MSAVVEPVSADIGGNLAVVREDKNQIYTCDNLVVAPRPSENLLAYSFLEFERQGLNKYIWYEGVPQLSWFLQAFKDRIVLAGYVKDGDHLQIQGLSWFNALTVMGGKFKKAEVGLAFFRDVPHTSTMCFGAMMADWAFAHIGLDVMYGATPVMNPAAIRFMRNIGFDHCGPVEGYCSFNGELCACEISWLTREKWDRIRPLRVEKEA